MRLATYNVEWFNSLFDAKNTLIINQDWSSRYNVTKAQQIQALGTVFTQLKADVIMVIEAPNTADSRSSEMALENFAQHFGLRARKALSGFANDTQQEITLLYDPDLMDAWHDPQGRKTTEEGSRVSPRFDGVFRLDVDVDAEADRITFSKPPLEAAVRLNSGRTLRLIGVHAKSKAPHGAKNQREAAQISIANRRKQLAQCIWLRQRVDDHLAAKDSLIVMGDFNDGPGLDEYEKLFGQSGVEIVLGEKKSPDKQLHDPHAEILSHPRLGPMPSTSRFYNHKTKKYLNALLDYIMISGDLFDATNPKWHIWHPFDDATCFDCDRLRAALLTASDHFPVTLDLDI